MNRIVWTHPRSNAPSGRRRTHIRRELGPRPDRRRGLTEPGGLVLRTLADHQAFTLRAFCQARDRSIALDKQALADRSGWDGRNGWLRRGDLNPRPSGYEPDELPDCSTPRHIVTRPCRCGQTVRGQASVAGGTCCSRTSGAGCSSAPPPAAVSMNTCARVRLVPNSTRHA